MTALHELGHVLNAWLSDEEVTRVELPPRGLGHTLVSPNHSPRFVAWGGALWGSFLGVLPVLLNRRGDVALWFARFFAGVCLVANGVYLSIGGLFGDPNGADDAHELLRHGAAAWQLWTFGILAVSGGLALWHGLGPRAGFRRAASLMGWKTITALTMFCVALLAIAFLMPA